MSESQVSIYSARTLQEAHLLHNLLEDAEIPSSVSNEVLQGGSGVDLVGWPTAARVMVAQEHVDRARAMAVEFDQRMAGSLLLAAKMDSPEPIGAAQAGETWPVCPQCEARRTTRCPICLTAGSSFLAADAGLAIDSGLSDLVELSHPAGGGACCGPNGCGSANNTCRTGDHAASQESLPWERMLVCPTCDEPFVPEFADRCEWCGHLFPNGFRSETALPESHEEVNRRIISVMVVILLGIAVGAFYFIYLLR